MNRLAVARRLIGVGTAGYGAALVLRRKAIAATTHTPGALVRVLGARYVVQGIAVAAGGSRWARAAMLVDGAHAATMVALLASPRHRHAALVSGAVAAGLSAAARWSVP